MGSNGIDALLADLLDQLQAAVREGVREGFARTTSPDRGIPEVLAVDVEQAAKMLSTPVSTIQAWCKTGALRASRPKNSRRYLVRVADLECFLRENQVKPEPKVDIEAQVARILSPKRSPRRPRIRGRPL